MALIDMGSVVAALLLGWLFLQEALAPAKLTASRSIVLGLLAIARGSAVCVLKPSGLSATLVRS